MVDCRLHQLHDVGLAGLGERFHPPLALGVDVLGHRQPNLTAALHPFGKVGHIDEGLHVHAGLDHLDGFAGNVADHLVRSLSVAEYILHVLLGDLEQCRHCRRDVGGFRVGDWAADGLVAVLVGHRVDEQVRIVLEVVLGPHHLMAGDLLGHQYRLLDR